jgi:hypothetical protein
MSEGVDGEPRRDYDSETLAGANEIKNVQTQKVMHTVI